MYQQPELKNILQWGWLPDYFRECMFYHLNIVLPSFIAYKQYQSNRFGSLPLVAFVTLLSRLQSFNANRLLTAFYEFLKMCYQYHSIWSIFCHRSCNSLQLNHSNMFQLNLKSLNNWYWCRTLVSLLDKNVKTPSMNHPGVLHISFSSSSL